MNSKKILASLLAASLCISSAALPASAADTASFEAGSNLVGGVPTVDGESTDFVTYDGYNNNYSIYTPTLYAYGRNGGVYLSWDWVSYATKYKVFYRLKGTSQWASVMTTDTHYTVPGLTNGKQYEFLVLATNGSAWSSYTSKNIVTCTPDGLTPYTPYTYIMPGNNSIYVDWYASNYAVKYRVFYRLNGTTKWSTKDTTESNCSITGLTNGKKYDVLVLQSDGKTWSPWNNYDIRVVTPAAGIGTPNFSVKNTDRSTMVYWEPVPAAVKYRVFYRPNGTSKWSYKDISKDKYEDFYNFDDCYYYVNGLKANTVYDFLVLSYNGSKWSSWTNADIQTLKTPASSIYTPYVTALGENKKIKLSWNEVPGATKYRVFYRVYGTTSWSYKDTTSTEYTITGLTNNCKYEVLVRSSDGKNYSSFDEYDIETATTTTAFWTPKLNAYTFDSSAVISWNEVPNAAKYRLFYRVNGTSKWTTMDTTDNWVYLENLVNGKKYDFLVLTSNGSKWSTYTKSDILTSTLVAKVDLPTFYLNSGTYAPMAVTWSSVDNAVKYRVFYRQHGTSKWTTKDIAAEKKTSNYSYILPGLTPGKSYDVLVLASDGTSWSKFTSSDILTATKYAN